MPSLLRTRKSKLCLGNRIEFSLLETLAACASFGKCKPNKHHGEKWRSYCFLGHFPWFRVWFESSSQLYETQKKHEKQALSKSSSRRCQNSVRMAFWKRPRNEYITGNADFMESCLYILVPSSFCYTFLYIVLLHSYLLTKAHTASESEAHVSCSKQRR